jgi:thiol-disulfide isomerase/thioredoxin
MALVAATVVAQDKPKDEPKKPSHAERFQLIIQDWQKAQEPIRKEFESVKDEDERDRLLAGLPARFAPFAEAAVKLAEENLKDAATFKMLMFAMMVGNSEKAADLLATTQQDNAQIQDVCMMLGTQADNNPAAEKLLKSLYEKATKKELRGCSGYGYAQIVFRRSEAAGAKDAGKLQKIAEDTAAAVEKDFGDVKAGESTLKVLAAKMLFEIRNLAVGRNAPEVVSEDLEGKKTNLSSYRGKVVVLDIWATWCGPCRAMIPHEREMVEKLKDQPFALISISADDEKDTLKKFLEKEKMPWTHWWEGRKEAGILKDWNVQFFPTIYVIDAKGVIRHKGLRGKKLEAAVDNLVKEAKQK